MPANSNLPSKRIKDLTGQRFNRLTVTAFYRINANHKAEWTCQCDCGNVVHLITSVLVNQAIKSCGCLRQEKLQQGLRPQNDLTGKRFGRWLVESFVGTRKKPGSYQCTLWQCVCDCGTQKIVAGYSMVSGDSQSCGCHAREVSRKVNTTHGASVDPVIGGRNYLYDLWRDFRGRCNNPKAKSFKNYGGRGISYYPAWDNCAVFVHDVVAEIGHRPNRTYSFDRINNNGNYEPGNIRWSTYAEQNRNKRTTHNITINDETMCLTDWATRCGQTPERVNVRINRLGWTPEEALGLVQRAKRQRPLRVKP